MISSYFMNVLVRQSSTDGDSLCTTSSRQPCNVTSPSCYDASLYQKSNGKRSRYIFFHDTNYYIYKLFKCSLIFSKQEQYSNNFVPCSMYKFQYHFRILEYKGALRSTNLFQGLLFGRFSTCSNSSRFLKP